MNGAHQEPDFRNCGLAKTLTIIGNKWTLAIIYQLRRGSQRFSDLQTALAISPRSLTLRLQQLEAEGIIVRQTALASNRIEYLLTIKGRSLDDIIAAMDRWGDRADASQLSPRR